MNLPPTLQRLGAAAAACLLCACAAPLPTYQPQPSDVHVSVIGTQRLSMCVKQQSYSLATRDDGNGKRSISVPAGARVMLSNYMSYQGYNVISSCHPSLSFKPLAGTSYFLHSGLSAGQCFIELVRADNSSATGVAPEPSVGEPAC
jgi:hypothetical protein